MSELRDRMVRDMTVRGLSPRTHTAYLRAVVGLARHYRRSPADVTNDEVQTYLAHLVQHRKLSWSTASQAANAFRFLYHVTLGHDRTTFRVPIPKQPQRLPEILSRAEVWQLLDACELPKHRLVLATAYAAGLRVSEVVSLKVSDIDPDRMTIRVEQGKGGKDRYVPLSEQLLKDLRRYWTLHAPGRWVFAVPTGSCAGRPIGGVCQGHPAPDQRRRCPPPGHTPFMLPMRFANAALQRTGFQIESRNGRRNAPAACGRPFGDYQRR